MLGGLLSCLGLDPGAARFLGVRPVEAMTRELLLVVLTHPPMLPGVVFIGPPEVGVARRLWEVLWERSSMW